MTGEAGLFFNAFTSQEVGVGFFVGVALKIAYLDLPLVDKSLETVIDLAQTDAQRLC